MIRLLLDAGSMSIYFGLEGWDCVLLGQGVPSRHYELSEPREAWEQRKRAALDIASRAVDHAQALRIVRERPEFLDELAAPDAWPRQEFPGAAV